jgi:hypothetical protein
MCVLSYIIFAGNTVYVFLVNSQLEDREGGGML